MTGEQLNDISMIGWKVTASKGQLKALLEKAALARGDKPEPKNYAELHKADELIGTALDHIYRFLDKEAEL